MENQIKEPDYQGFVEHLIEATEKGLPTDFSYLRQLAKQYGTPIPKLVNNNLVFDDGKGVTTEVEGIKVPIVERLVDEFMPPKPGIFINKQKDNSTNLDLFDGRDLEYYLELTKDFKSSIPDPVIKKVNSFYIVDESVHGLMGTKARFGEFLLSQIKEKEIVYVQPATGFAGISLSFLAKQYNKNVTLFMPARAEATDHQLLCIELGAKAKWRRIAAMPVLQGIAKKYAEENDAFYIPFGLKHELVAAGAVRAVHDFFKDKEHPEEMWTVASTGVLTRALQIALPNTKFFAVGVARNMQHGELGRAQFISYHKPFLQPADYKVIEFDTVDTYDAKGFEYMRHFAKPGAYFWNVAANVKPEKLTSADVDSYREWKEVRD
jgi:hypothetical protein